MSSGYGGRSPQERSCLRDADLSGAYLTGANLGLVDLSGADLRGARLGQADLRYAELAGIDWKTIKSMKLANIYGVKNPPEGFVDWAIEKMGAVSVESDEEWEAMKAEAFPDLKKK